MTANSVVCSARAIAGSMAIVVFSGAGALHCSTASFVGVLSIIELAIVPKLLSIVLGIEFYEKCLFEK